MRGIRAALLAAGALGLAVWALWVGLWTDPPGSVDAPERRPVAERGAEEIGDSNARASIGSAPASAARPGFLLVRTVDERGAALGGAEVFLADDMESASCGTTDAAGRLEVTLGGRSWTDVHARFSGLGTASARRPDGLFAGDEVVLRLAAARSIRGRVVWFDGTSAGQGIEVIGVPPVLISSSLAATAERIRTHPGVPRTTTDPDGNFELRNLPAEGWYIPVAGGPGIAQPESGTFVPAGATDVSITIGAVFGTRVFFAETDGLPARIGPMAERRVTPMMTRIEGLGCVSLSVQDFSSCLAGLDPLSLGQTECERALLFCCPARTTPLKSIHLSGAPCGYAPFSVDIPISVVEGEVPTTLVTLERRAAGFGSLEVRLADEVAGRPPETWRVDPLGVLHFEDEYGQTAFNLPLFDRQRPVRRFDDLPFGSYRVRYECAPHLATVPNVEKPPLRVVIGPEVARLDVPALPTGVLEIDPVLVDGTPYRGPLQIIVGPGWPEVEGPGRVAVKGLGVDFLRAPYVLRGLEPGPYALLCSSEDFGGEPRSVQVAGDAPTRIRVQRSR